MPLASILPKRCLLLELMRKHSVFGLHPTELLHQPVDLLEEPFQNVVEASSPVTIESFDGVRPPSPPKKLTAHQVLPQVYTHVDVDDAISVTSIDLTVTNRSDSYKSVPDDDLVLCDGEVEGETEQLASLAVVTKAKSMHLGSTSDDSTDNWVEKRRLTADIVTSSISDGTPLKGVPSSPQVSLFKMNVINAQPPKIIETDSARHPRVSRADCPTSGWSRLKDQLAKVWKDRWTTACISATKRSCDVPNEKHIKTILAGLDEGGTAGDRNMPLGAILFQLRMRLESSDWAVVLKTLIVFHTIFRNGNQWFVDYLANVLQDAFNKKHFEDSSLVGQVHSKFIRLYANYLQTWLRMREAINFPATKTMDPLVKRQFDDGALEDILDEMPYVLDTIAVTMNLHLTIFLKKSPVARTALLLMLRDLSAFTMSLAVGMDRLVAGFDTLRRGDAVQAVMLYARYRRLGGWVRVLVSELRDVHKGMMLPLPIDAISEEDVERMKKYIEKAKLAGTRDRSVSTLGSFQDRGMSLYTSVAPYAATPYPKRLEGKQRALSQMEDDLKVENALHPVIKY